MGPRGSAAAGRRRRAAASSARSTASRSARGPAESGTKSRRWANSCQASSPSSRVLCSRMAMRARSRKPSALSSSSEVPTTRRSSTSPDWKRCSSPGMSLRLARSPVAPNRTTVVGAVMGSTLARPGAPSLPPVPSVGRLSNPVAAGGVRRGEGGAHLVAAGRGRPSRRAVSGASSRSPRRCTCSRCRPGTPARRCRRCTGHRARSAARSPSGAAGRWPRQYAQPAHAAVRAAHWAALRSCSTRAILRERLRAARVLRLPPVTTRTGYAARAPHVGEASGEELGAPVGVRRPGRAGRRTAPSRCARCTR